MVRSSQALALVVFVTAVISLASGQVNDQTITTCTYDESICGCKTDKGDINLKQYEDKGLQATNQPSKGKFDWNPCKDITVNTVTAAVVQDNGGRYQYDCGTHISTETAVDAGNAVFKMMANDQLRSSQVACKCGTTETDSFTFDREDEQNYVYYLTLTSKNCCPGGGGGGASSGGLSGGSILLIVFFVTVFVYIVGGIIIQAGVRKQEGSERFPNVSFWSAVPGLIQDGVRFTFTCGRSAGYGEV